MIQNNECENMDIKREASGDELRNQASSTASSTASSSSLSTGPIISEVTTLPNVNCKLCGGFMDETGVVPRDQMLNHARDHAKHLRFVEGFEFGIPDVFDRCFPNDRYPSGDSSMAIIKSENMTNGSIGTQSRGIGEHDRNRIMETPAAISTTFSSDLPDELCGLPSPPVLPTPTIVSKCGESDCSRVAETVYESGFWTEEDGPYCALCSDKVRSIDCADDIIKHVVEEHVTSDRFTYYGSCPIGQTSTELIKDRVRLITAGRLDYSCENPQYWDEVKQRLHECFLNEDESIAETSALRPDDTKPPNDLRNTSIKSDDDSIVIERVELTEDELDEVMFIESRHIAQEQDSERIMDDSVLNTIAVDAPTEPMEPERPTLEPIATDMHWKKKICVLEKTEEEKRMAAISMETASETKTGTAAIEHPKPTDDPPVNCTADEQRPPKRKSPEPEPTMTDSQDFPASPDPPSDATSSKYRKLDSNRHPVVPQESPTIHHRATGDSSNNKEQRKYDTAHERSRNLSGASISNKSKSHGGESGSSPTAIKPNSGSNIGRWDHGSSSTMMKQQQRSTVSATKSAPSQLSETARSNSVSRSTNQGRRRAQWGDTEEEEDEEDESVLTPPPMPLVVKSVRPTNPAPPVISPPAIDKSTSKANKSSQQKPSAVIHRRGSEMTDKEKRRQSEIAERARHASGSALASSKSTSSTQPASVSKSQQPRASTSGTPASVFASRRTVDPPRSSQASTTAYRASAATSAESSSQDPTASSRRPSSSSSPSKPKPITTEFNTVFKPHDGNTFACRRCPTRGIRDIYEAVRHGKERHDLLILPLSKNRISSSSDYNDRPPAKINQRSNSEANWSQSRQTQPAEALPLPSSYNRNRYFEGRLKTGSGRF